MQYPIIDTIYQAYIINGWTGLDISTGKNLAYIELIGQCPSVSTGNIINHAPAVTSNLINVESDTDYTFTRYSTESIVAVYVFSYDINNSFIGVRNFSDSQEFTLHTESNVKYLRIRIDRTSENDPVPIIQFELGTISTPYEPYSPKSDFPNRLKLPLPHYFPHPVIDALISAADGQQTEEENEILRHYLTPLGIGGI